MKKTVIATCLLFTAAFARAQAPTSQEEYNYATKGLKIQRANGLDMKSGYTLVNGITSTAGAFTILTEDLLRIGDKSLACTIVEINSPAWTSGQGPIYFCIPNPKSAPEINNQFWQALQLYSGADFHRAMSFALATRTTMMTNNYYNYGKK